LEEGGELISLRAGDNFQSDGNSYEVQSQIGEPGGFGAAFLVVEQSQDGLVRELVAKAPNDPGNQNIVSSFKTEYRVLKELESLGVPNIVRAVCLADFVGNPSFPVLVMERAESMTLKEATSSKPLSYEDASDVLSKLAAAMTGVHKAGYMHLDIAPDNVFIDDPGGANEITIIDFGIAARKSDTNTFAITEDQHGLHKPFFAAPEQPKGEASQGSDIFSVGATGFSLILGFSETLDIARRKPEPPYDLDYYVQGALPHGAAHLHGVIKKATWHDRGGRFTTMEDMGQAIAGKLPNENFHRIESDGITYHLTGDGPWRLGREGFFDDDQPDIIVKDKSVTNIYISRKQATIERRADGILILKDGYKDPNKCSDPNCTCNTKQKEWEVDFRHISKNGTRVKIERDGAIRWNPVDHQQGYPIGARHQEFCFGYANHDTGAKDKNMNPIATGPYKIVNFFPPSKQQSEIGS